MSDMSREEAHDWLCRLRSDFYIYMGGRIPEEGIKRFREALDFAISSIKTDEAYQLEYENRDCLEVVRCKDCKHYRGNSCEWHNGFKPPVDWFCADGEREGKE